MTPSGARRNEAERRKRPLRQDPAAVRYALDMSGLSQAELARRTSRSESTISEILAGTRSASATLLRDIAHVLNCPLVVLESRRDIVAEPNRTVA